MIFFRRASDSGASVSPRKFSATRAIWHRMITATDQLGGAWRFWPTCAQREAFRCTAGWKGVPAANEGMRREKGQTTHLRPGRQAILKSGTDNEVSDTLWLAGTLKVLL